MAFGVAFFASLLAALVGGAAGMGPRWLDAILMRAVDVVLTLPELPLLIVAAAFLGQGLGIRIALMTLLIWAESGSGKSTVAKALLGLLPATATVTGSARLGDIELIGRAESTWQGIRGPRVAIVPQGAMTGLNPVRRVGAQLAELLHLHAGVTGDVAATRSRELLRLVRLDPGLLRAYPHQLSGGMRQRVAIALALAGGRSA